MRGKRVGVSVVLIASALAGVAAIAWYCWCGMRALPAARHGLRRLTALPPGPGDFAGMGLAGADLRALNLHDRGPLLLAEANFDSLTVWPTAPWRRPSGFNPGAILEEGKNPGLGLRALHQRGITGKGVAIAIIDQDLLVDHVEYRDRLRLYGEDAKIRVVATSCSWRPGEPGYEAADSARGGDIFSDRLWGDIITDRQQRRLGAVDQSLGSC